MLSVEAIFLLTVSLILFPILWLIIVFSLSVTRPSIPNLVIFHPNYRSHGIKSLSTTIPRLHWSMLTMVFMHRVTWLFIMTLAILPRISMSIWVSTHLVLLEQVLGQSMVPMMGISIQVTPIYLLALRTTTISTSSPMGLLLHRRR